MKLFEIEFKSANEPNQKAWALDIVDALMQLGFTNPQKTLETLVSTYWVKAQVTL